MKRIEKIHAQDIRELCIERNWFNNGTNKEYNELFAMVELFNCCGNSNRRNAIIQEIAKNIAKHSTADVLEGYEHIDLANAVSFYVKVRFVE